MYPGLYCSVVSLKYINTGESVSSGYPNTKKRVKKIRLASENCDEIRAVWTADETLS